MILHKVYICNVMQDNRHSNDFNSSTIRFNTRKIESNTINMNNAPDNLKYNFRRPYSGVSPHTTIFILKINRWFTLLIQKIWIEFKQCETGYSYEGLNCDWWTD